MGRRVGSAADDRTEGLPVPAPGGGRLRAPDPRRPGGLLPQSPAPGRGQALPRAEADAGRLAEGLPRRDAGAAVQPPLAPPRAGHRTRIRRGHDPPSLHRGRRTAHRRRTARPACRAGHPGHAPVGRGPHPRRRVLPVRTRDHDRRRAPRLQPQQAPQRAGPRHEDPYRGAAPPAPVGQAAARSAALPAHPQGAGRGQGRIGPAVRGRNGCPRHAGHGRGGRRADRDRPARSQPRRPRHDPRTGAQQQPLQQQQGRNGAAPPAPAGRAGRPPRHRRLAQAEGRGAGPRALGGPHPADAEGGAQALEEASGGTGPARGDHGPPRGAGSGRARRGDRRCPGRPARHPAGRSRPAARAGARGGPGRGRGGATRTGRGRVPAPGQPQGSRGLADGGPARAGRPRG